MDMTENETKVPLVRSKYNLSHGIQWEHESSVEFRLNLGKRTSQSKSSSPECVVVKFYAGQIFPMKHVSRLVIERHVHPAIPSSP